MWMSKSIELKVLFYFCCHAGTLCKKWIHKRCSGVRGDISLVVYVSGVS